MILLKLQAQYPRIRLSVLLKWANLARNSLQMWNGFSSHQLVFGQNPNLPDIMTAKVPALEEFTSSEVFAEHLNALHAAREAYIQSEASERIKRALRHRIRASQQVFHTGERVYYKRDCSERWLGPGKVMFQDSKVVFVRHGNIYVRVSVNRLIKADGDNGQFEKIKETSQQMEKVSVQDTRPSNVDNYDEDEDILTAGNEHDVNEHVDNPVVNGPVIRETVDVENPDLNDQDGGIDVNRRSQRLINKEMGWNDVYLTFVPRDQLGSEACVLAKKDELEKLQHFNTYEVVPDQGQSRISTRWVMTLKDGKPRARLVARGFEESEIVQSDSPTVGKSSVRIFLSIVASKHWIVQTTDVKSAFLQGKELDRTVFIVPPIEADARGKLWRLKRCLYGLSDASRKFYQSVTEEMLKLGCRQSILDPSLFYLQSHDGVLMGVMVSHIDDFLHAGNDLFDKTVMEPLRARFLSGKVVQKDFSYVGFWISQSVEGIVLNQDHYVNSIRVEQIAVSRSTEKQAALNSKELTAYRALVGSINWCVNGSRPDLAYELIDLSTKFRNAKVEDWLRARKVMRMLQEVSCIVFFPDIGDLSKSMLVVFTDAGFANLPDKVSSTAGYVVFLVGVDKACPLVWKSNKIKRIVKSTLGAETMACLQGLEEALYLKQILLELQSDLSIPIVAYVDSKSLKDNVHSTKLVDNRLLRIDIARVKQMLQIGEVQSIRWCTTFSQLANCLTKRGASGSLLLDIFHTGKLVIEA
jgi:hypothetical protein